MKTTYLNATYTLQHMNNFKNIVKPIGEDNNQYNETYHVPYRQCGKSTIIKELGLVLKSLGYKVYIVSNNNGTEYYADERFYTSEIETKLVEKSFDMYTYVLIDDLGRSERDRVVKATRNACHYFGSTK